MLPKDFPPFTTVQNYFYAWRDIGVLRAINNTLVMAAREQESREASPSAGVIDEPPIKYALDRIAKRRNAARARLLKKT